MNKNLFIEQPNKWTLSRAYLEVVENKFFINFYCGLYLFVVCEKYEHKYENLYCSLYYNDVTIKKFSNSVSFFGLQNWHT